MKRKMRIDEYRVKALKHFLSLVCMTSLNMNTQTELNGSIPKEFGEVVAEAQL